MFRVVDEIPSGRGRTGMSGTDLIAAAKKARGKWVSGRKYASSKTASNRATWLRRKYPEFEFASRRGVIYCRKAVAP